MVKFLRNVYLQSVWRSVTDIWIGAGYSSKEQDSLPQQWHKDQITNDKFFIWWTCAISGELSCQVTGIDVIILYNYISYKYK